MNWGNSTLRLALFALLLLTSAEALAQEGGERRRGTAGAEHLLVPLTARATSLGTTLTSGIAGISGLEALDANPAGLTLNGGTNAIFSRMEYVADIGVNYFGLAQRFGSSNLALTLSSWDFGDIPLQTEDSPDISDVTWTAQYTTFALAFAREFTDRISAGVNVKMVSETIDDVSATGVAFDAGMTYAVGESGLRFGVSLKNFGPDRNYSGTGLVRFVQLSEQIPDAQPQAVQLEGARYELPSLLNFGVAYSRPLGEAMAVTVLGNFRSNSFSQDQYAGALELGFKEILFVRGGYEFQSDMDQTFWNGTNLGAGLVVPLGSNGLEIDYAYRSTEFFDAVHMWTVGITL
jgi:hypothetical protein